MVVDGWRGGVYGMMFFVLFWHRYWCECHVTGSITHDIAATCSHLIVMLLFFGRGSVP
jgi:hypothetical protein